MDDFIFNIYDYLVSYFNSPEVQRTLLWIKLISAGICALLLLAMIILLSRSRATWWIEERIDSFRKVKLPQRVEHKWQKIQERLQKSDEANLKLAIIEADNLMDELLKRMAFPGRDMGERLQQFEKHELASIDEVWEAHRLRNLIVHQPSIIISQPQAEAAIKGYEAALKELEVI